MNNYWTARLALLTPFVMTGLLYIASFFLSKITKERFLWPSGKTLFDYAFLKKEHEIDQKYQKNFRYFKFFIFATFFIGFFSVLSIFVSIFSIT